MENSDPSPPLPRPPKTPKAGTSMDSTSVATLQLRFGNLRMNNGKIEMDDSSSAAPQGDSPSSVLPLSGSLTDVLPGPELSNRESLWSTPLKKPNLLHSFDGMNLNYTAYRPRAFPFPENLKGGYTFGESYPYNWTSPPWKNALFNDVNLFNPFLNENPFLQPPPAAIPTGENLFEKVFNLENLQEKDIITLAMEENSSRDLQALILKKDPRITELIFKGVIDHIVKLMTSQYGRYLFQKLVELGDENLLRRIMGKLTLPDRNIIFYASVDRYGSYSIKKLINVLQKSPLVSEVVKALSKKFWDLMINPTGQYVIMECLEIVDSQKNDLLYDEAIEKCLQLATHERGCISLNGFTYRIKGPKRDQLLNEICDQAAYLAQDPVGNFVVQFVLGLQNPAIIEKICLKLRGYYVKLSMQKGGSYLVEKSLQSSGLDHVVHEFIQSSQLYQVAKDRYGNYVLQTALTETKTRGSPLHEMLIQKLRLYVNSLQYGYGRKVLELMTAPH